MRHFDQETFTAVIQGLQIARQIRLGEPLELSEGWRPATPEEGYEEDTVEVYIGVAHDCPGAAAALRDAAKAVGLYKGVIPMYWAAEEVVLFERPGR